MIEFIVNIVTTAIQILSAIGMWIIDNWDKVVMLIGVIGFGSIVTIGAKIIKH